MAFSVVDMPTESDEDEDNQSVEDKQPVKQAPDDKAENLSVKPTEALNGAQIQAALSVIEQVVKGMMPPEAGKELLVSLGLQEAAVDKMMGAMDKFEAATLETEIKAATIPADE